MRNFLIHSSYERHPLLEKVITEENYKNFLKEEMEAMSERKEKKTKKTKKTTITNMVAQEFIIPGTPFYNEVNLLNHMSGTQIGLFLLGLDKLRNDPKLGGIHSRGCGKFVMEMQVYEKNQDGELDLIDQDILEEYMDEAREAVEEITPEDIKHQYGMM